MQSLLASAPYRGCKMARCATSASYGVCMTYGVRDWRLDLALCLEHFASTEAIRWNPAIKQITINQLSKTIN